MFSENVNLILQERYLAQKEDGSLETPEEMFRRVAHTIAKAEAEKERTRWEQEFYSLISELRFLPNTPALSNAGRPMGQLAACFFLPVHDSIDSIFTAIHQSAIIHQTGGGTGFNFSNLREAGALVRSTGKTASGPVSFMRVFDAATNAINQGGVRRGANMGILRVDHPDIIAFINCKRTEGAIRNFNLSVGITDEFMQRVEDGQLMDLVSPMTGKVVRRLPAREILETIVDNAWATGEPGVVYLGNLNRANVLSRFAVLEGTNPCGEQPLFPYESCVLGSINLPAHLSWQADGTATVDWDLLKRTVECSVRFLDNCIDVTRHPLPEIAEMTPKTRKIGLGIMGWADFLLALRIRYDSEQALSLVDQVMGNIYHWADAASRQLGEEKGEFPLAHMADETVRGRRNATVTTIAPTGTISIIAGVSSGIEPLFGFAQVSKRNVVSKLLFDVNSMVARYCRAHNIDLSAYWVTAQDLPTAIKQVDKLQEYLRQVLPDYFVTSQDISPEWHLRVQAAFQRYVDNAVSKTINLPNQATKKDVEKIILEGYRLGLKGLTVYRDGSRESQVIYVKDKPIVRPRPPVLDGRVYRIQYDNGTVGYITISLDEQRRPFEVFANSLENLERPWNEEAIFRLVSIGLRACIPPEEIAKQLEKANNRWGGNMFTTPALLRRLLLDVSQCNGTEGVCPSCGSPIKRRGTCVTCNCGYSSRCD